MYMVIVIEVSHKHRATLFSETPKPEAWTGAVGAGNYVRRPSWTCHLLILSEVYSVDILGIWPLLMVWPHYEIWFNYLIIKINQIYD